MRFSHQELLEGMLATLEKDDFPDDEGTLQAAFKQAAAEYPLFAPFGGGDAAVSDALKALEGKKALTRDGGRYHLTEAGRARCVSSKRTLFNKGDVAQLEGAAKIFASL